LTPDWQIASPRLGNANALAGTFCYSRIREQFWEAFMKLLATLILAAALAVGVATVLVSPPASADCGASQCYGR
jgi:hypothetical protein